MKVVSNFANLVYQATKKIPKGKISTYGQVARYIGRPKSYRAVGNALNKNPFAPKVPCHRVVTGAGLLGGFAYSPNKKRDMLKQEGIEIRKNRVVDFKEKLFVFRDTKY
ncbi:MAG: MGMT family protein [Bacilli bacterium]|jgi:O-6-methylguanine DNA methyltransferase